MIKNSLSFFIILLLTVSCSNRNTAEHKTDSDSTPAEELEFPTTDYIFHVPDNLPAGYYFDTITVDDTVLDLHYTAYCLQSHNAGGDRFNAYIRNTIHNEIETDRAWFAAENHLHDMLDYTWELGPVDVNITDSILSQSCIIDTYSWGGAHHNYQWYCFNYDLKKDRPLFFRDVFRISSARDSVAFTELVLRNKVTEEACMDWGVPFDSVAFTFTENGISVTPDLSWACGMQESLVPYDSIRPFLRKK